MNNIRKQNKSLIAWQYTPCHTFYILPKLPPFSLSSVFVFRATCFFSCRSGWGWPFRYGTRPYTKFLIRRVQGTFDQEDRPTTPVLQDWFGAKRRFFHSKLLFVDYRSYNKSAPAPDGFSSNISYCWAMRLYSSPLRFKQLEKLAGPNWHSYRRPRRPSIRSPSIYLRSFNQRHPSFRKVCDILSRVLQLALRQSRSTPLNLSTPGQITDSFNNSFFRAGTWNSIKYRRSS